MDPHNKVRLAFVILDLAKLITSCKHAYYTGAPSITDENYDRLEVMLMELCPTHPILDVVGVPNSEYKNLGIGEIMKILEAERRL